MDVGIEKRLDFQRSFRCQPKGRAVEMGLKSDPVLVDLPQRCQRHHLKAAGVGEDRPRPVGEGMQPAKRRHPFGARPQHQVVGVAEDDVGAEFPHLVGIHRLDGAGRADRHEGRRTDDAARQREAAGTGGAVGRRDGKIDAAHPYSRSCIRLLRIATDRGGTRHHRSRNDSPPRWRVGRPRASSRARRTPTPA